MQRFFFAALFLGISVADAQTPTSFSSVTLPANVIQHSQRDSKSLLPLTAMLSASMGPQKINPGDEVELGYGFDVFTGQLGVVKCVYGLPWDDDVPAAGRNDPSGTIKAVSSLTEMRDASGLSGEASLMYKAFSFGASGSQYRDDYFKSTNNYVAINMQVVNRTERFRPRLLTNDAKVAVGNGRFKSVCGQMYVRSISHGSAVHALAELNTTFDSSHTHNDASVKVGIAGFLGLGGNSSSDYSTMTSNSQLDWSANLYATPLGASPPLDKLVIYAYNLAATSANADDIVAYTLAPYENLPVAPQGVDPLPTVILELISSMASERDQAVQLRNDIRFTRQTPYLFGITEAERVPALQAVDGVLQLMANAVDKCRQSTLDDCKNAIKAVPPVPTVDLKRK